MNHPLPPSDQGLFEEAVADVAPLHHEGAEPYRRPRSPHPLPQPRLKAPDQPATLAESEVETHELLLFVQPGVQRRLVLDLQRGRIPVDLELDLHGLTVAFAQELLERFLTDCRQQRVRCARIIHGKGTRSADQQPVLKRKVNYWLRLHPEVLAFTSATPRDGGSGALYVLLRNPRKASHRR